MVICNRCHRNIPERQLAAHLATHKGKAPLGAGARKPATAKGNGRGSLKSIVDQLRAEGVPPTFEEFTRQRFAKLGQKSSLSLQEVKSTFLSVLKKMDLKIRSLAVEIKRAETLTQVTFNSQLDVRLEYDDHFFQTLDKEEIEAVLSHEACHIATLPDTSVLVSAGDSMIQRLQSSVIECYDEFLAHEEFKRRFADSQVFSHYKVVKDREFSNYESLLTMARSGVTDPATGIFLILNDATYFPVVGSNSFAAWCKVHNANGITKYLDWILDDFRYVKSLELPRIETMRRAHLIMFLALGVNMMSLLAGRSPAFVETASEAEIKAKEEDEELAQRWKNRRLGA